MTDTTQHRERRHLVRHVLSKSNIDDAEPLIAKQVRKALGWAGKAEAKGESLEIMLWLRRMMLDTAGMLAVYALFRVVTKAKCTRKYRRSFSRERVWSAGD